MLFKYYKYIGKDLDFSQRNPWALTGKRYKQYLILIGEHHYSLKLTPAYFEKNFVLCNSNIDVLTVQSQDTKGNVEALTIQSQDATGTGGSLTIRAGSGTA